jgi:hypothetical protein
VKIWGGTGAIAVSFCSRALTWAADTNVNARATQNIPNLTIFDMASPVRSASKSGADLFDRRLIVPVT